MRHVIRKYHRQPLSWPSALMSSTPPARSTPSDAPIDPLRVYIVKARGSSCRSKKAVINRYEAGIEHAAEIPLRALNTRNEYLSVMNEMMRLSNASASDPQQNTGLAELKGGQRSILFSPPPGSL